MRIHYCISFSFVRSVFVLQCVIVLLSIICVYVFALMSALTVTVLSVFHIAVGGAAGVHAFRPHSEEDRGNHQGEGEENRKLERGGREREMGVGGMFR
jgi:hypothetical protein